MAEVDETIAYGIDMRDGLDQPAADRRWQTDEEMATRDPSRFPPTAGRPAEDGTLVPT